MCSVSADCCRRNNYLQKSTGAKADFVVGQNSAYARDNNEFALGGRAFHAIDDKSRLWTSNAHGKLIIFPLPFSPNTTPLANFVDLYWADSREKIDYYTMSVAFDKVNKRMWISDSSNNRLLGISNYNNVQNELYVDI